VEVKLRGNALKQKPQSYVGDDGTKGLFARRRPNRGSVGGRGFCVNVQKI